VNIDQLAKRIEEANEAYRNGNPIMSDAAFDALEDQLRAADPNHAWFDKTGAAPTSSGAWTKVRHAMPMRSLNKLAPRSAADAKNAKCAGTAELEAWVATAKGEDLFITEKMDGISIALRFESGKLVQALTRGDGETGEDITRNVKVMKGLPTNTTLTAWVRGEIVVRHSDFKAHFPGDSNPRNTASGTAKRQSDASKCKHLTVFAYQLIPDDGAMRTKADEISTLEAFGFQVTKTWAASTAAAVASIYDAYVDGERAALDYDIDGLVIDVNDNAVAEGMGEKNHRPAGAVAFKFPHEAKATVLRDIQWQVGNSGRVTPVAIFDTVNLAGANVSKASLHNLSNIGKLLQGHPATIFGKGYEILVSRRNDVIPYVEEVIACWDVQAADELGAPDDCPVCATKLTMKGEYLMCPGTTCDAQASGGINRWTDKLNILGWGSTVVDALVEANYVKDVADLYDLMVEDIADLQLSGRRVGESTATTMLTNLHAKKELPLHVLVGSLGIDMCARSVCKMIVDAGFDTLRSMNKATTADLTAVPKLGNSKAEAFVKGFAERKELIARLLRRGVTPKAPATGPMKGKAVCMTGFRDAAMADAIEDAGGTVKSGVSKGLDYLVAKDPTGTSGKLAKARKYGTQVIGVDDMWKLLGGKQGNGSTMTVTGPGGRPAPAKKQPNPKHKAKGKPSMKISDLFS